MSLKSFCPNFRCTSADRFPISFGIFYVNPFKHAFKVSDVNQYIFDLIKEKK